MNWMGTAWKVGDHVDTDAIIPARYLATSDVDELARHCMEDILPAFAVEVCPGDVLVAGENFGCGSSREHAPLAIQGAGVSCIVAASFARIFYRNAFNVGLPIVTCPDAAREAQRGHVIEIDLDAGRVINRTLRTTHQAEAYPAFILELIAVGGLIPFTKTRLESGTFDALRSRAR